MTSDHCRLRFHANPNSRSGFVTLHQPEMVRNLAIAFDRLFAMAKPVDLPEVNGPGLHQWSAAA